MSRTRGNRNASRFATRRSFQEGGAADLVYRALTEPPPQAPSRLQSGGGLISACGTATEYLYIVLYSDPNLPNSSAFTIESATQDVRNAITSAVQAQCINGTATLVSQRTEKIRDGSVTYDYYQGLVFLIDRILKPGLTATSFSISAKFNLTEFQTALRNSGRPALAAIKVDSPEKTSVNVLTTVTPLPTLPKAPTTTGAAIYMADPQTKTGATGQTCEVYVKLATPAQSIPADLGQIILRGAIFQGFKDAQLLTNPAPALYTATIDTSITGSGTPGQQVIYFVLNNVKPPPSTASFTSTDLDIDKLTAFVRTYLTYKGATVHKAAEIKNRTTYVASTGITNPAAATSLNIWMYRTVINPRPTVDFNTPIATVKSKLDTFIAAFKVANPTMSGVTIGDPVRTTIKVRPGATGTTTYTNEDAYRIPVTGVTSNDMRTLKIFLSVERDKTATDSFIKNFDFAISTDSEFANTGTGAPQPTGTGAPQPTGTGAPVLRSPSEYITYTGTPSTFFVTGVGRDAVQVESWRENIRVALESRIKSPVLVIYIHTAGAAIPQGDILYRASNPQAGGTRQGIQLGGAITDSNVVGFTFGGQLDKAKFEQYLQSVTANGDPLKFKDSTGKLTATVGQSAIPSEITAIAGPIATRFKDSTQTFGPGTGLPGPGTGLPGPGTGLPGPGTGLPGPGLGPAGIVYPGGDQAYAFKDGEPVRIRAQDYRGALSPDVLNPYSNTSTGRRAANFVVKTSPNDYGFFRVYGQDDAQIRSGYEKLRGQTVGTTGLTGLSYDVQSRVDDLRSDIIQINMRLADYSDEKIAAQAPAVQTLFRRAKQALEQEVREKQTALASAQALLRNSAGTPAVAAGGARRWF